MSLYRKNLPQLQDKLFITDGGMETDLVFHHKIDLPEFASYDLLRTEQGYDKLYDYYDSYVRLGQKYKVGLILETPTWRANTDWGKRIGDSQTALDEFNARSVQLVEQVRADYLSSESPVVISGCIGPRGDGYVVSQAMTAKEAQRYHSPQVSVFAASNADMIGAITMNYVDEAIGISLAAKAHNIPVCISFTVETDGKLATGETVQSAIEAVDQETDGAPAYYMINCAHPTHFEHLFEGDHHWLSRLKGIRCNASCLSHAELDESEELDEGNPLEFGQQCSSLRSRSTHLNILGGCCGTDHRHIEQVCEHLAFGSRTERARPKESELSLGVSLQ